MKLSRNVAKEASGIVAQLKRKLGGNIISIVQIGSSLRPRQMVPESDIDFVVVTRRKRKRGWKRPLELGIKSSYETNVLDYSAREFKRLLAKGEPVPLMAVNFGRPLFGRMFWTALGRPAPTAYTAERWYENGLRVYSMAIAEYFSGSCVCCYLKDCHHAARSLLRAKIVRGRGPLCEADRDIIGHIGDERLATSFKKLANCRKRPSDVPLDVYSSRRGICGRAARPLIIAEDVVCRIVGEIEGKKIRKLADVLARVKRESKGRRMHSIWLSTHEEGKAEYLVSLFDQNNKISHMHLPFYKP